MTQKISKKDLKKKFEKGWEVERVETPEPVPEPTPSVEEIVAGGVKQSSTETLKVVSKLTEAMTNVFNKQLKEGVSLQSQINKIIDKKIIVEIPKANKKKWRFTVERDGRGFIENIIATEM